MTRKELKEHLITSLQKAFYKFITLDQNYKYGSRQYNEKAEFLKGVIITLRSTLSKGFGITYKETKEIMQEIRKNNI